MPATSSDFETFLNNIQVSKAQIEACRKAATEVNERLLNDAETHPVILTTFLQGSARRGTHVRPVGDKRSDVDLVVATLLEETEHSPPAKAWERFVPFLERCYGPRGQRWRPQDRSVRLLFPHEQPDRQVELDLVVTSTPSLAVQGLLRADPWLKDPDYDPLAVGDVVEETLRKARAEADADWKLDPLRIPDRALKVWEDTHPLAQVQWARAKSGRTNGHYVPVAQSLKWWQRVQQSFERPKGFTLEAIVGACCPDGLTGPGEGITRTLAIIAETYAEDVKARRTPELPDVGTGLNVLARIEPEDFATFHAQVTEAARLAEAAMSVGSRAKACQIWRMIFGPAFPEAQDPAPPKGPTGDSGPKPGIFTPPPAPAIPRPGRFA